MTERVVYGEEHFDAGEFPEGYRCACCRELFTDDQIVVRLFIGEMWTCCACKPCADAKAPLCDEHPLRDEASVVLGANGDVR